MKKIIIDTDPGIDDAVAIAVALMSRELDVKLLSSVAGNVPLENTTVNALKLVEFFGKADTVPVARGAAEPIVVPYKSSGGTHGKTGLDGYPFPEPTTEVLDVHAVEAIRRILMESDEKISILPIGPLTNIALLFRLYPEVKERIDRIIIMGGSASYGNSNQAAEFNLKVDPEAGRIVFESGVPIVMCGLDVTRKAVVTDVELDAIKSNETGRMLAAILGHYKDGDGTEGWLMHDLCAVAYLVRPDIFVTEDYYVEVVTGDIRTQGMTWADRRGMFGKEPNTTVVLDLDLDAFKKWFVGEITAIDI